MKYIVYLTTNLKSKVNGINKVYIGVHQTENPEIFDGYIGCGVYVQQPSTYMYPKTPFQYAVKKYGTNAFQRQILYIYDDKESVYKKEQELVNNEFIKQSHVYNVCLGGIANNNGKPIYQFDLTGKLVKVWEYSKELYDFYGYSRQRFIYAIQSRHPFLNSYWATTDTIDIIEYISTKHSQPKITYLYDKNGKCLNEFMSEKECAEYLNILPATVNKAIKQHSLVDKSYYISDKLVDEFKPKQKRSNIKRTFYVYDINNKFYGKFVGKEVMKIINLHSWGKISDIFRYNHGWFKDFYLSDTEIENVPEKRFNNGNGIAIDVYDKYGNFIETINTVKEVKLKYKVPAHKIKNIQMGNRYYNNYIFKYHSF